MARPPRVVAELGRPETPEETATRKANASLAYRSSQTMRNLLVALGVTLAVVAVIIFAVPRADYSGAAEPDPAAVAASLEADLDRPLLVPEIPAAWRESDDAQSSDPWRVNAAGLEGDSGVSAWSIAYATSGSGYLRLAQGLDADQAWARSVLRGQAPTDTVTIDGIEWDRYTIGNAEGAGNISFALGTQAGPDHVLLYGTAGADTTEDLAGLVADQIRELRTEEM